MTLAAAGLGRQNTRQKRTAAASVPQTTIVFHTVVRKNVVVYTRLYSSI